MPGTVGRGISQTSMRSNDVIKIQQNPGNLNPSYAYAWLTANEDFVIMSHMRLICEIPSSGRSG